MPASNSNTFLAKQILIYNFSHRSVPDLISCVTHMNMESSYTKDRVNAIARTRFKTLNSVKTQLFSYKASAFVPGDYRYLFVTCGLYWVHLTVKLEESGPFALLSLHYGSSSST